MKVRMQVEIDLGQDTRSMLNVEAAVADATQAAMDRLGFSTGAGHRARSRVKTEVSRHGETVTVRKDVSDTEAELLEGGGF